MGAFCSRFTAEAQLIRRYIEAGEFGEIYHVKASANRRRGIPGLGGWFTTKERTGGGCMLDIGVHALDRAYWQIGSPEPVSVTGAVYQMFANVEPTSYVQILGTKSGCIHDDASLRILTIIASEVI